LNKPSELKAIEASCFKIGEPVPWNIYDAHGGLLLRKGFIIANAHQLAVFGDRALFVEKAEAEPHVQRLALANVSVVCLLKEAALALREGFRQIGSGQPWPDSHEKIHDIVKTLQLAIDLNTDICLAHIFFNKFTHADYPLQHSLDTALLALLLAQALEKPEAELRFTTAAALTMNVGMLTLQEQLLKRSDKLTPTEKTRIRQHPEAGVELLRKAGVSDEDWLACVLCHHEKIDGSGYPGGLGAADIPQGARIVSLADRYSACLSPRRFRPGMLATGIMRDLFIHQAATLDVELAGMLVRILGIYPPGTFVRLQNGELAVVVRRGKTGTTPLVISFVAPRGGFLPYLIKRDTREKLFAVRGSVHLEAKDMPYTMSQLWGRQAEPEPSRES